MFAGRPRVHCNQQGLAARVKPWRRRAGLGEFAGGLGSLSTALARHLLFFPFAFPDLKLLGISRSPSLASSSTIITTPIICIDASSLLGLVLLSTPSPSSGLQAFGADFITNARSHRR
jgi:hypothetical protein